MSGSFKDKLKHPVVDDLLKIVRPRDGIDPTPWPTEPPASDEPADTPKDLPPTAWPKTPTNEN